jgi:creatinine amidohydrolase
MAEHGTKEMQTMDDSRSPFAGTMADMTYPQVERAARRGAVVLLATGVIEQHGPHLPLATDVYGALQLCRLVARELARGDVEALLAPPLCWGVNVVSSAFPGTFRVRPQTAEALHDDVLDSLHADGFRHVFLVNHHGDLEHNRMLLRAVRRQHERGHDGVVWLERDVLAERLGEAGRGPYLATFPAGALLDGLGHSGVFGVHAEETEGAMVMRWFPELVDWDALDGLEPTRLGPDDLAIWREGGEHARRVTPQGFFGAPKPQDPFLWRLYDRMATAMAGLVRERLDIYNR